MAAPTWIGARAAASLALCLCLLLGDLAVLAAGALTPPTGRVLLTVSGAIERRNAPEAALFDREMLEALGTTVVETVTPWTDGPTRFEGVLARDVLAAVGARGTRVTATALNDYVIEIPVDDFVDYPVILAMKMNDEPLRTRTRGPLWIIYPWSEHETLRSEVYHSRAVWQLKRLDVKP